MVYKSIEYIGKAVLDDLKYHHKLHGVGFLPIKTFTNRYSSVARKLDPDGFRAVLEYLYDKELAYVVSTPLTGKRFLALVSYINELYEKNGTIMDSIEHHEENTKDVRTMNPTDRIEALRMMYGDVAKRLKE